MTTANIDGHSALRNSPISAKQVAPQKTETDKKTVDDVLDSLRKMMLGWTISTSTADWGEGVRNIQIDQDILERMANDPREMERVKSLIREFESAASELEQWKQQNPGQSFEIGISLDTDGNARALIALKTLMGDERSTAFDLPNDRTTWADFMRQTLDALNQGKIGDVSESRNWTA